MGVRELVRYVQRVGVRNALRTLVMTKDFKEGSLVGRDQFGNKYFESRAEQSGRTRWVKYANTNACEYDPSQVPPEWHHWLHHMSDAAPTPSAAESAAASSSSSWLKEPKYKIPYTPNLTWSKNAYTPPGHYLSQDRTIRTPYTKWRPAGKANKPKP
jgi:NADH:ubiquinone oxidoreductase subunit